MIDFKNAPTCEGCGRNPAGPTSRVFCENCRVARNMLRRNRERIKKEKGQCARCNSTLQPGSKYCSKHLELKRESSKKHRYAIKDAAFRAYGGYECACCGETRRSFLSLDHVHGGGNKHRKEISKTAGEGGNRIYYWLKKNGYPDGFQVLCHNCNHSKSVNGGECEHKFETKYLIIE